MLASTLGTGCFNLPYRVHQLAVVPFMVLLSACAIFAYTGMYMMERVIIRYKVESYAQMM